MLLTSFPGQLLKIEIECSIKAIKPIVQICLLLKVEGKTKV